MLQTGAAITNRVEGPSTALLLFGLGLLLLGLVFGQKLLVLAPVYTDPDYSHGMLVPAISLYLLWARLPRLRQEVAAPTWWGVPLLAVGCLAFLVATVGAMSKIVPWLGTIFALTGLIWSVFGHRVMLLCAAPLLMLLLMLPITPYYLIMLTVTLQLVSSEIAAFFLSSVGIPVYLDGNIIDLGGYQLMVAEACSGLRYLLPLLCLAAILAYLVRGGWALRLAIILVTVPITVVLNSLRIMLTGLFVEFGYPELADGTMHLIEGWLIFLVALLTVAAFIWGWRSLAERRPVGFDQMIDFSRIEGDHIRFASRGRNATGRNWGVPALSLAVLVATLVGGQLLQARTPYIPDRTPLIAFPLMVGDWRGNIGSIDDTVLEALAADDHLYIDYVSTEVAASVNLWVAYYGSQTDGDGGIHSPAVCLPGAGWEYVTFEAKTITPRGAAAPFAINRGIVSDGRQRMLIYYWFDLRGRKVVNETELRILNFWDSLSERRSDGALVRLITPILPGEDPTAADARLLRLLDDVQPLLDGFLG
jgi:exosortase D (VPLPA-CTERM-specific)